MTDNQGDDIILLAQDITKIFPGTVALDHVSFGIRRGKVNALVGQNGAGKSTLMKILVGVEQPNTGRIIFNGQEVKFSSPRDARKCGIGIIYQELDLFPNLNVIDNIFAGRELRKSLCRVDYKTQERIAIQLLDRLKQPITPRTLVEELRLGQQQVVAIAKALAQDVKILIMDEPTSALSSTEIKELFRVLQDLKDAGVSIVYISHKLDEVLKIADYITVLRDGRIIAEAAAKDVNVSWMIEKMVGENLNFFYNTQHHAGDNPLLRVEGLTLPHPRVPGRFMLDRISFSLRPGEILGFFGLIGSGRTELLECLAGRYPEARGSIWLDGQKLNRTTIQERIHRGLVLIPEDRHRDGIIQTMSVQSNMSLSSLRKYIGRVFLSNTKERAAVKHMTDSLAIRMSSLHQSIMALSGGNQQKVIIAKTLLTSPRVLMMDEPTRGIDVGAKFEIFKIISDLAAQGYGIIFVSSEVAEVLAISDRILVLANGHITGEFNRVDANQEVLMAASMAS